jgi:proteasome accessory factor A
VGEDVGPDVLLRWEEVLTGLESNPESQAGVVDWIAKRRIMAGIVERRGIEWSDATLRAIDLQYHDMRVAKSLSRRAGLDKMVDEIEWRSAMTRPPDTTRAYFRGTCLAKYGADIVAANWDSLVFDVGAEPLKRVPMLEPLRGTREMVGRLLDESATAADLLGKLGA